MENEAAPCKTEAQKTESYYWLGITRIENEYGFFKIPVCHARDEGWLDALDSVAEGAASMFKDRIFDGDAVLSGPHHSREELDAELTDHIKVQCAIGVTIWAVCRAIVDFTRTSLPQLSGKAVRDAYAMAYYHGQWEERVRHRQEPPPNPFLGFGNHGLVFGGRPWLEPKDFGGEYYEKLRREHPLVIFWRDKNGNCVVHPDYDK
ncbi:MAG: hypothetical protein Q7S52_01250 [bacterium]|nr:hypothetical protein [bacterium]